MMNSLRILGVTLSLLWSVAAGEQRDERLAGELSSKGWIVFSAQTAQGDWDLFLTRPDGSMRRPLTQTPDFNEAGPRFSPDGKRLLYYRMAKSDAVDNNTYGTFDLVIADSNGRNETVYGRNFAWASWGPDGTQIACLSPKFVSIVDVATHLTIRTLPRQGIVQQLVWSPDGSAFAGTANGLGEFWNIGRLAANEGKIVAVSETERYNCTPDWAPDSRRILYSRGIIPKQQGRAQLWVASEDGRTKAMMYAEEDRHIYGACASPDAAYLLFTRSIEDLGAVGRSQTTLAIIRWAETPMVGENSPLLQREYPHAKPPRRLDLGPGWEPHWTYSESPSAP